MPNRALVLVAAAVLEAREKPSTYSSRRPGRHVPTIVDQVVSFTIATDEVMVTVPVLLSWRRYGVTPLASHKMWSSVLDAPDLYRLVTPASRQPRIGRRRA
jgi:hypothetical protein